MSRRIPETTAAFTNNKRGRLTWQQVIALPRISSPIDDSPTYAEYVAAIALAAAEVYDDTGRVIDTLYLGPGEFFKLQALTPKQHLPFSRASGLRVVFADWLRPLPHTSYVGDSHADASMPNAFRRLTA